MLRGIIILLFFQFLGDCIANLFTLLVPGPVIGMILLLVFLLIKKGSFSSLDNAVALHLRYLPLLFIPAAMGIITQIDIITKEFWAIFIALFFGTLIALVFAAKFMDFLTSKVNKDEL
jgi:putative effector of murein hydrolase LrgA (UPF0299 family)